MVIHIFIHNLWITVPRSMPLGTHVADIRAVRAGGRMHDVRCQRLLDDDLQDFSELVIWQCDVRVDGVAPRLLDGAAGFGYTLVDLSK